MIRTTFASLALMSALLTPHAQAQDFSKVEIRTIKLSDSAYVMEGAGGNLGLSVGADAVFLIDDQFAPLSEKIAAAIAKITPKPVQFILNTHWHGDHTGGNENFARTGAIIVAHENVRKRLSSEQFLDFTRRVPPSPEAALPIVTFAGAMSFHVNGDELRVIHVARAHTDGDAIVHFLKSDVVHMGDVYWNGLYPFIDTASGGTVGGMIAACDQVLGMVTDKTRIVAGHGPAVSDKAGLKAYRDMLAAISGRVTKMIDAGRKLEEIVAANPTADFDDQWGKGYLTGPKFAESIAMNILKNR